MVNFALMTVLIITSHFYGGKVEGERTSPHCLCTKPVEWIISKN